MNTLATKSISNPFSGLPYDILLVDGQSLEDIVLATKSTELIPGLVPTFLDWLEAPAERAEVWCRALPPDGSISQLPVLMCSEDIDLWCTLIMVEVSLKKGVVHWHRFGLEISDAQTPDRIGQRVQWFDDVGGMSFDLKNYEAVLEHYRKQLSTPTTL